MGLFSDFFKCSSKAAKSSRLHPPTDTTRLWEGDSSRVGRRPPAPAHIGASIVHRRLTRTRSSSSSSCTDARPTFVPRLARDARARRRILVARSLVQHAGERRGARRRPGVHGGRRRRAPRDAERVFTSRQSRERDVRAFGVTQGERNQGECVARVAFRMMIERIGSHRLVRFLNAVSVITRDRRRAVTRSG